MDFSEVLLILAKVNLVLLALVGLKALIGWKSPWEKRP